MFCCGGPSPAHHCHGDRCTFMTSQAWPESKGKSGQQPYTPWIGRSKLAAVPSNRHSAADHLEFCGAMDPSFRSHLLLHVMLV
jgi:hypothetical protein